MPALPGGLQLDLPLLMTVGGIVLIDMVLSGDNALVIGAAASHLPRAQRVLAIVWGGIVAIVARIVLAAVATTLLQVSLIQAIGGAVLLVIAIRLLLPHDEDGPRFKARDRLLPAILTILFADVTMSTDNIIAIGALAHGDIPLLIVGLVFSMAFLFLASALIARIIERVAILLDLAALVLAYTAANLIVNDPFTDRYADFGHAPGWLPVGGSPGWLAPLLTSAWLLRIGLVALVLVIDLVLRGVRRRRRATLRAAMRTYPVASGAAARRRTHDVDLEARARGGAMDDADAGMNGAAPRPLATSRPRVGREGADLAEHAEAD